MARWFVLAAVLLFDSSVAYQLRTLGDNSTSTNSSVCVSLPAYEDAEYVDALLENVLYFTEPSTKIGVHFDRRSQYNASDLARWVKSGRVVLVSDIERVETWKWTGAILAAYLAATKRLEHAFPGQCEYIVMQSSNMMWVRKGMEQQARHMGYAGFQLVPPKGDEYIEIDKKNEFFKQQIATKGIYAKGQPEGAVYPMRDVLQLAEKIDWWLAKHGEDRHDPMNSFLHYENVPEATWIQTYMMNNVELKPQAELEEMAIPEMGIPPLCLRVAPTNLNIDHVNHVRAAKKEYQLNFTWSRDDMSYAVKRVPRRLDHEVTQYIISLSK